MQYPIKLSAGVPARQLAQGVRVTLLDLGAAATVDLSVEIAGYAAETYSGVRAGLNVAIPPTSGKVLTGVTLTSPVDTTVQLVVTDLDLEVSYHDGQAVNATIVAPTPVPVTVNGTTATQEKQAAAITDNAAVAVNNVLTPILAANAARLTARIANIGSSPVAIGGAGLTWARRTIVLNPGDVWIEDRAAALAWSAICDVGGATSITVQELA